MPRRLDATWAEWGAPPGEFRQNPPKHETTIYRRDRNGFTWLRRVGPKDWVTISEAASILKVNPATAWQWTRQKGRLPVVKRRGVQLVRFSDVLKLAEERGLAPPLPRGPFLTG
jgi:hypothetical protein